MAITGGLLYGAGVFLASFTDSLWWLYLTYGVIGGIGLGFGYIVPVAVLVKWFPDRRGLITGVAVGGFGAGALVTAPVATRLIQSVGVLPTFAYLGLAYLLVVPAAGFFMRNPPAGWQPEGWTPAAAQASQRSIRDYTLGEALRTPQWWMLWGILFLNVSAGIYAHLPAGADIPGTGRCHRPRRGQHGWHREHRERGRTRLLGVALGRDDAQGDVHR